MKLVRMRESRTEKDHYIDGVNYLAFAGEFANLQSSKDIAFGDDLRNLIGNKEPVPEPVSETAPEPTVEEMAAKLAPEQEAEPISFRTSDFDPSEFLSDKKSKKA